MRVGDSRQGRLDLLERLQMSKRDRPFALHSSQIAAKLFLADEGSLQLLALFSSQQLHLLAAVCGTHVTVKAIFCRRRAERFRCPGIGQSIRQRNSGRHGLPQLVENSTDELLSPWR